MEERLAQLSTLLEGIAWRRPVRSYDPQMAVRRKDFFYSPVRFHHTVKKSAVCLRADLRSAVIREKKTTPDCVAVSQESKKRREALREQ
jgi:hypothetical protein